MNRHQKEFLFGGVVIVLGLATYIACSKNRSSKKSLQEVVSTPIFEQKDLTVDNLVPEELSLSEDDSGVFFGTDPKNSTGYVGKPSTMDGHILVVGGPGSGKTSSIANPTAKTWKGSSVSLLIKGDHNERICQLQKEGRRVIVFNPAVSVKNRVRYDVFSILNHQPEDRMDNAYAIAETLIPLPEGTKEPVWVLAGQTFLAGAILHYYSLGCSFPEMIHSVTTQSPSRVVQAILDSGNQEAISFASHLSDIDQKLLQNTGFELVSLSRFLSPQIMTALTVEDDCTMLDWEELNHAKTPIDIVLIIPEAKLDQWRPMLTLMMDQLIRSLMSRPERTYDGCEPLPALLVSLDEFNRIGKLSSISSGLMTLRSRGVTFMLLMQSLSYLDLTYGELQSRTIQENCSFKLVLGVSEPKGQQYFSDLIGTTTTIEASSSCGISVGGSIPFGINIGNSKNTTYSLSRRPNVFPETLAHLDDVLCITPYVTCHATKTPDYAKQHKQMAVSGSIFETTTERTTDMNNKKTSIDQVDVHQIHRQEKQLAFEKQQVKKSYAKLSKQICTAIFDVFPELKSSIASDSGEIPCEVLEQIEDIKLVLRYFSTHPRVLNSLRTGVLSNGIRTDV